MFYKFMFRNNKSILSSQVTPYCLQNIWCVKLVKLVKLKLVMFDFGNRKSSYSKFNFKQDSPPAWTQEACRPPRSKYSICCPIPGRGTPSWPGGGSIPSLAGGNPFWDWGTPQRDLGPVTGVPIGRYLGLVAGVPRNQGPVKVSWDGDGVPPGVDRHLWKQYLPVQRLLWQLDVIDVISKYVDF